MADANATPTNVPVTDGNAQDSSSSSNSGASTAADSSTSNVPNEPTKDQATTAPNETPEGARGPVTDSAKVEQQTGSDSVATGSGPVGATAPGLAPDPVLTNQYLSGIFNDLEAVLQRAEAVLAVSVNISGLREHVNGARDWVADKLGLDKNDDGTYLTHSGYAANPSMLGQTTGQAKQAAKDSGGDDSSSGSYEKAYYQY